jgi:hypothetical protein
VILNSKIGLKTAFQLAVTEVNGCAACSYQYIMMALRQGMSKNMVRKNSYFSIRSTNYDSR